MMNKSSPGYDQRTTKSSKFQSRFQIATSRVLLNKAVQALKKTPEGCGFLNATNFHRFHVLIFKLFSLQHNDQLDSESPINTQLLHLLRRNHSVNSSND